MSELIERELMRQLDEATTLIAALVNGDKWVYLTEDLTELHCMFCHRTVTRNADHTFKCDHAPDCPVGLALAWVGKRGGRIEVGKL
jgi:hypothetical protein